MEQVLVVAAHPDDEVLGAGGIMARHISKGDRVSVLILGEGITSRYPKRSMAPKKDLLALEKRSLNALRSLGIKDVTYSRLPDNRFDGQDLLDIVKIVEGVKKRVKPSVIYTHHIGDLNRDHHLTCQAVVTATRPMPGETVKRIYSFEVLSSSEWNFARPEPAFTPNVYMDITKYLAAKIRAFEMYDGEVQPDTHPRSSRGLETLAAMRGLQSGLKYAEAFQLIREIA